MQSEQTAFYYIEKSIKSYRQYAQKMLVSKGFRLTIDQGLVLNIIQYNPGISQQEIAEKAFKDNASITRIIENLVNQKLLLREFHPNDRRRFVLKLSEQGKKLRAQMKPVVEAYRKKALGGISEEEIETLKNILGKITQNCQ